MKDLIEMNKDLFDLYTKYLNELVKEGTFYTQENNQIIRKNDYSNPYFVGIPNNWNEKHIRIMIVGEEGYGEIVKFWNKDGTLCLNTNQVADINDIQNENLEYVNGDRPWNYSNIKSKTTDTTNTSRFWQVFKKIEYLDNNITINDAIKNKSSKVAVIWNECDKICHTSSKGKLSESERTKLHKNINIDILKEEIKILQPTHIVFLGWYSKSLKVNNWSKWATKDSFKFELDTYIPDDKYYANITRAYIKGNEQLNDIKIYCVNHPQCSFKTKNYISSYDEKIGEIISNINQDYNMSNL